MLDVNPNQFMQLDSFNGSLTALLTQLSNNQNRKADIV